MKQTKIVITGVGGQGVVFLTEVLTEAAVRAKLHVATSEIHGLSQRGGSVIAGITIGENTFGFVENGGADFLIGLEVLETERCIPFLNKNSVVITDSTIIFPHAVNAQKATYPDVTVFLKWLKENVRETIFVDDEIANISSVMRNLLVLGYAAAQKDFPVKPEFIEAAIRKLARGDAEKSVAIFKGVINKNNLVN